MKLKMYSLRDEKAEAYMTPFFLHNHGLAMRTVQDMLNNPEHPVCKHKTDFSVWYLGEYDDASGTFEPEPPSHLFNVIDL